MANTRRSKDKLFQNDMEYRMYRLRHFAQKHGWHLLSDTGTSFLFQNSENIKMIIDYTNLEIQTCLIHPQWGKTNLLRKGNFTQKIIESIFINPRQHMKGAVKSEYV